MPRQYPDLTIQVPRSKRNSRAPDGDDNFGIPSFSKRRPRPRSVGQTVSAMPDVPAAVQSNFLERFSLAQRYSRSSRHIQRVSSDRSSSLSQSSTGSSYHAQTVFDGPFLDCQDSPIVKSLPPQPDGLATSTRPQDRHQKVKEAQANRRKQAIVLGAPRAAPTWSKADDEKRAQLCPWELISPTPATLWKDDHGSHKHTNSVPLTRRLSRFLTKNESRLSIATGFVIFALVIANLVVLDITTVVRSKSASISSPTNQERQAELCLAMFDITAPADPVSYPCSTCFPALLATKADNTNDDSDSDDDKAETILDFCALGDIVRSLDGSKQTLTRQGWLGSTDVCTWQGVSCSFSTTRQQGGSAVKTVSMSERKVTGLDLDGPDVPPAFPASMTWLQGRLERLTLNGIEQHISPLDP